MIVAITICTRQRPVLLAAALESLTRLCVPQDVVLQVIVVENDVEARSKDIVTSFADRLNISHHLESEPGLSPARNRCIEEALKVDALWIASTDDDAEVHPNWIAAYLDATSYYPRALAFMGRSRFLYPLDMPEWYPVPDSKPMQTGSTAWLYSTSNAFYNRAVVASDGLNLRFDNDFRFSGSEDTDFFSRLRIIQGPILWVEEALVFEEVIQERNSLKWRFKRMLRDGNNLGRIKLKHNGNVAGALAIIQFVLKMMGYGILKTVKGGIILVFNELEGMKLLAFGLADFVFAAGVFSAFFMTPPVPYKKTDGF